MVEYWVVYWYLEKFQYGSGGATLIKKGFGTTTKVEAVGPRPSHWEKEIREELECEFIAIINWKVISE